LMALDAFVTEGEFGPIPAQNNFIPPPVPVDSTIGVANLPSLPNLSATTVVKGYTVEEPTTLESAVPLMKRCTKLGWLWCP